MASSHDDAVVEAPLTSLKKKGHTEESIPQNKAIIKGQINT